MTRIKQAMTERRLSAYYALVILVCQMGAGLSFLIRDGAYAHNPTYAPARTLFDWLPGAAQIWWAAILVAIVACAGVALAAQRACFTTFMACLVGYWSFWSVMYFAAWQLPSSGALAPWLALIAAIGNSRPIISKLLIRGG